MMIAEWQQQSMGQNQREQEAVTGHNAVTLKPMRIDVARFEDGDPQGWIFKIQSHFDFHDATEDQRLQIAPLYFDGKTLTWYQWLQKNTKIGSWDSFLNSL